MLFDECRYDGFKFPEPQYLGAKFELLSWIAKFIPKNVEVAVDGFAGSQSHADYQAFYHLPETFVRPMTRQIVCQRHQAIFAAALERIRQKSEAIESFSKLFERATHIPRERQRPVLEVETKCGLAQTCD